MKIHEAIENEKKAATVPKRPQLNARMSSAPAIQEKEPVSYTHLTLPTIYSV